MALSNSSRVPEVVDLAIESDSKGDYDQRRPSNATAATLLATTVPLPGTSFRAQISASNSTTSTPLPSSIARDAPAYTGVGSWPRQTPNTVGTFASSNALSNPILSSNMGRNISRADTQSRTIAAGTTKGPEHPERSPKRRKLSISGTQQSESHGRQAQPLVQGSEQQVAGRGAATAAPRGNASITINRNTNLGAKLSTMSGVPSVHFVNSMLKPTGASSLLLDHVHTPAPRPLSTDNLPQDDVATGLPSPGLTTPESLTTIATDVDSSERDVVEPFQSSPRMTTVARRTLQSPLPACPLRPAFALDVIGAEDEDNATSTFPVRQPAARRAQQTSAPPSTLAPAPSPVQAPVRPTKNRNSGSSNEEADHLLIFLKEVKKLKWADITKEFARDISGRTYVQLQSRYSQVLNKRDRTQDPPTLNLPTRFAAEAKIDWVTVHANTEGPRVRKEVAELNTNTKVRDTHTYRPRGVRIRDDDSSSTDAGPQRQRRRRVPVVNYTLPKLRTAEGGFEEWISGQVGRSSLSPSFTALTRSESPANRTPVLLGTRSAARSKPLELEVQTADAQLGLDMQRGLHNSRQERKPYLSWSQRLAMRVEPQDCSWEQQNVQVWQGTVLHVDFSPAELKIVENIVADLIPSDYQTSHRTYRRHLRKVLRNISSPKMRQMAHQISRCLQSRDSWSVASFLEDAASGTLSDVPRIQRLAMTKPHPNHSSVQDVPVRSLTRSRELGLQSKRGWRTARATISYQLKNQLTDTLGPKSTWTGASSDIHTVAWSPDGQYFAAGAVTVTDSDSMQYNRPNVLIYGDTLNGHIHELGEHRIARPKTETGANSRHAMYVSQDPKLYTTVSSVAFSPSGRLMYSAGYDNYVYIWDVTAGSRQPQVVGELQHKAAVDVLAINPRGGCIATATTRTTEKSIKLVSFNEDEIYQNWAPRVNNFASTKALNRPDLNMAASALKFDSTGGLLLAGFGANVREDSGLDTSGDICLWDAETGAALRVHGSSRNVFDLTFNPAPRYQGLFAVGCVANGNVNRGARSVVRFYALKGSKSASDAKFTCPIELECKAFDMNDVVWCPYDENLFAAGCTDGRSYVWDLRRPDSVLYTLSHGSSLMPLQDCVPHERTDTGVRFLSWGQNARRLYSGSSDGVVKVWDVNQSQEDVFVKDLITTNSGIMSGAFTADYSKLVLGEVNGTANVLEVGRDDVALLDAEKFIYQPYQGKYDYEATVAEGDLNTVPTMSTGAAVAEARSWLETGQLQLAPAGGLPKQQVIQGPNYHGPYDRGEGAQTLRDRTFAFQRSMAMVQELQCDIAHCVDSINTTTQEDIGDSGRSKDRIPAKMRRQWLDESQRLVPGKSQCKHCSRPAIPCTEEVGTALCERCSFTCFRCHQTIAINGATSTLECGSCGGTWDIGALGYECVGEPLLPHLAHVVPTLNRFKKETYLERLEDADTTFGDELNALTDYYFSLAIDRPESPPLYSAV